MKGFYASFAMIVPFLPLFFLFQNTLPVYKAYNFILYIMIWIIMGNWYMYIIQLYSFYNLFFFSVFLLSPYLGSLCICKICFSICSVLHLLVCTCWTILTYLRWSLFDHDVWLLWWFVALCSLENCRKFLYLCLLKGSL